MCRKLSVSAANMPSRSHAPGFCSERPNTIPEMKLSYRATSKQSTGASNSDKVWFCFARRTVHCYLVVSDMTPALTRQQSCAIWIALVPLRMRVYSQAPRTYLPERVAVAVGPRRVRDASDTVPKVLRPVGMTVDEISVMLGRHVARSSSSGV